MSVARIAPDTLVRMFEAQDREFALLDPMEEGAFAVTPHLIQATNIPLSVLELRIGTLVPRLATPIVLAHDRNGLGQRAARVLATMGYSDISLLEDPDAILPRYVGFNVKSKAFGEVVEHSMHTPTLEPAALRDILKREDCILVDVRPFPEYHYETIPGAINLTGAAFYDLGRTLNADGRKRVIVSCGGRTRSILGAQSLIEMGVPNVASLKNGTMGWHLAGFDLDHGAARGPETLPATGAAVAVPDGSKVPQIRLASWQDLDRLRAEGATGYLFDLRSDAEISAKPIPDATSVSGIQLIQATDCYCAVHHAAVFLYDPTGSRADLIGGWLAGMGITKVSKITQEIPEGRAADRTRSPEIPDGVGRIAPETLVRGGIDCLLLDLTNSHVRSRGHIPQSVFAIRAQLDPVELDARLGERLLVLAGDDAGLVALTCRDLQSQFTGRMSVMEGGSAAWVRAGGVLEPGLGEMLSPPEDVFVRPMERSAEREAAMQSYLDWEIDLIRTVRADPTVAFSMPR